MITRSSVIAHDHDPLSSTNRPQNINHHHHVLHLQYNNGWPPYQPLLPEEMRKLKSSRHYIEKRILYCTLNPIAISIS